MHTDPKNMTHKKKRSKFWHHLDSEVLKCSQENVACVIAMDGNCWLGSKINPKDPHDQNNNGRFFEDFLSRNENLVMLTPIKNVKAV